MQMQDTPSTPILYLRRIILFLICLTPLLTLVHENERGQWVANHSAFIAPDEFGYLLTAQNIAAGKGITLHDMPADSFYPPGFPALLALWGKAFGFSIVSMHVCVTALQCVAVGLAYLIIKEMLRLSMAGRGLGWLQFWMPVLLTALYASSWHTVVNTLSIFAEPAFTCVTLLWLWLALRYRHWWRSWRLTAAMALLAVAAASIRASGIICVMTTAAFPILDFMYLTRTAPERNLCKQVAIALAAILLIAAAYYGSIQMMAPERGLFTTTGHSYTHQLIAGLTKGYTIPYYNIPVLAGNALDRALPHFDSWAQLFCPPPREDASNNIPRVGIYIALGRILLLLAAGGWLFDLLLARAGRSRILAIYVLLYAMLYAVWPFDAVRFWVPTLPIMLAYAWETIGRLQVPAVFKNKPATARLRYDSSPRAVGITSMFGVIVCLMLLILNVEEIILKLPFAQNRYDFVSDCLRGTAQTIASDGGNPQRDVMASGDPLVFGYYTGLKQVSLPEPDGPPDVARGGVHAVENLIAAAHQRGNAQCRVYIPSYFTDRFFNTLATALKKEIQKAATVGKDDPAQALAGYEIYRIYRRDMVTLWVVSPRRPMGLAETP